MITVFTCTYNREKYLKNLYFSLVNQTSKDFEWLIVDDGSTDKTENAVNNLIEQEHTFKIKYKKTENGGKHRAINRGMELVGGSYIFLVDSDDELCKDAIEKVLMWTKTIDKDNSFAGVAGLMACQNGDVLGGYPSQKKYKNYVDARCVDRGRYRLTGDKAIVLKTNVMKKYPFPEIVGENFLLEGTVWNRMSLDGYKIRWFPDIIYIAEYLDDGLTNDNMKLMNNWEGFTLTTLVTIRASKGFDGMLPIARYIMYGKRKGISTHEIINTIHITNTQYFCGNFIQEMYKIVKNTLHKFKKL